MSLHSALPAELRSCNSCETWINSRRVSEMRTRERDVQYVVRSEFVTCCDLFNSCSWALLHEVTEGPLFKAVLASKQPLIIYVLELVRNLVAHGDAREWKWRGNWRMEWVASTLTPPPNVVYPALLKLMRTPPLPAVDWTDAPTDLNGLVRFGERRNVVSARVPSRSARAIQEARCVQPVPSVTCI